MKVTIRDVARRAGVGVGTVSRVLNQKPSVSESTREKVLSAIQELQYTPNSIARRLSLGKTMTIAVIAPFFTRSSYVERLRGVESVLSRSEYDLVIYNVETVAKRNACLREVPRRERIDGLLIMSLTPDDDEVERFATMGVPAVLIDATHPRLSRVIVDDVAGGYRAARHLIDLGHRRIAFVSDHMQESPFDFRPVSDRYRGYRKALEEANIPFRPQYHREGRLSQDVARQQAVELLSEPDPPTAIFAYSDTQAFGVLNAAEELDVRVPDDLSVIGYDDVEASAYVQLTTIRQNLLESGARGAELLLEELTDSPEEPQEIVLPTELIRRNTTAPPRTRPT